MPIDFLLYAFQVPKQVLSSLWLFLRIAQKQPKRRKHRGDMTIWLTILGMALVTYATRVTALL
ncbi:MAG TPA: hypothetical protein PKK78_16930, partial [Kouleothrix sp.]|nr:hypothetical protein [Kouleothrix sp.]